MRIELYRPAAETFCRSESYAGMVEVRHLTKREHPPEDEDRVLVEQAGGRFVANGSVTQAGGSVLFFRPPAFQTLDEAINAAKAWAFDQSVPVVYVRVNMPAENT